MMLNAQANHESWQHQEANEAAFLKLCRDHDLTHVFADYHFDWLRGRKSLAAIYKYAEKLPRDVAVRIWNQVVDEKITPETRSMFHWKE